MTKLGASKDAFNLKPGTEAVLQFAQSFYYGQSFLTSQGRLLLQCQQSFYARVLAVPEKRAAAFIKLLAEVNLL